MNPETSLSNEQIQAIFNHHKLAKDPKISRITTGFTNEVHQVDGYILKVCVREKFDHKFKNEIKRYRQLQGKAMVPKFILSDDSLAIIDKPYMIYEKIPGESLGNRWHLLSDEQRRLVIRDFCEQLRIISRLEPNPKLTPGPTWLDNNLKAFKEDFAVIKAKKLLPEASQRKIINFVESNQHVLIPQKLALMNWDPILDNMIVDRAGRLVGLIDFEHVGVVSLDYVLNRVKQMTEYPWLTLSVEAEKHADKKDYAHLFGWYKEFYPEMFDFPELGKRLDLYELEGVLRLLPRFPRAQQLHDRISGIISR